MMLVGYLEITTSGPAGVKFVDLGKIMHFFPFMGR